MDLFEKVSLENERRRQRILEGKFNCLPFPFQRFRKAYPGVEQGKYIIITASQKIGKSKLADSIFIYEPLFYMMEHPELKVKVLYFTLEMSAEEKFCEFECYLLAKLDKIHIDTRELRSVDHPCDPRIDQLLHTERYQKYIQAFLNMVKYYESDKNPTGINKRCREYALAHGHMNYTTYTSVDEETGEVIEKQTLDPIEPYTQDDADEFRIIILDNAANINPERDYPTKSAAIEQMSKYGITLKRQLKFVFVLVQHQAQAQEGIENIKLGRMRPTADGLGDCKTTVRDVNCIMGLYNPFKFIAEHKQEIYDGYNIKRLAHHFRILEIIDDRDYGANGSKCPLFFDGAISTFKELPLPDNKLELEKFYKYAEYLDSHPDSSESLANVTFP